MAEDARARILARVRAALADQGPEAAPPCSATSPRPQWAHSRYQRFLERLERAAATYSCLDSWGEVVVAVDRYLEENTAPRRLLIAPHPALAALDWPAEQAQLRDETCVVADWPVALSYARAGIAETGSLVLPSSPASPTSLNFLPDHHLVVLETQNLVDYLEDGLELAAREGLPRALNLITGPSRTADIEQTLQLGAHGPRRLHVILVGKGS